MLCCGNHEIETQADLFTPNDIKRIPQEFIIITNFHASACTYYYFLYRGSFIIFQEAQQYFIVITKFKNRMI